jgi:hypothetical protein
VAVAAARRAVNEVPAARDLRPIFCARVAQRQAEEHGSNTKRNNTTSDDAIHMSLPNSGDRGGYSTIDLINKLEADSRAARLHRQLVKPAI